MGAHLSPPPPNEADAVLFSVYRFGNQGLERSCDLHKPAQLIRSRVDFRTQTVPESTLSDLTKLSLQRANKLAGGAASSPQAPLWGPFSVCWGSPLPVLARTRARMMPIITSASLAHALKATTLVCQESSVCFSISTTSQDVWKGGFAASFASSCLKFTKSKV